jgi:putative ABC transport system permease protein
MLVPLSYSIRSLFVRKSATALTLLGLASTVAVLAGVLALQQGFVKLFDRGGREDVAVFLRPGALSEQQSYFRESLGDQLIKTVPEIAQKDGAPLAAVEVATAVRLFKLGGSGRDETNVSVRGVQPASFEIFDNVRVVEGRKLAFGSNEAVVGVKLGSRIQDCKLGDVVTLNATPFQIVGVMESDGPFDSEIWCSYDQLKTALKRDGPTRVVARLRDDVRDDPERSNDPKLGGNPDSFDLLAKRLEDDKETPATVTTDLVYLKNQTGALGTTLMVLGVALSVIMGVAAVFTATNTMLSAVVGRTHEIGVMLSLGFRPFPIFLSFLFEAVLLGLLGGALGCLLALPVNGIETGTTNWNTFTEVAFAFRVTPGVLASAVIFSMLLGLLGGCIPAWKAARLQPTEALRRR